MPGRTAARAWLLAVACALSFPACGLFDSGSDGGNAARTTTTKAAPSTTTTTEPVLPVVADAGAEPRRALRYDLAPGATTVVTVTVDSKVTQADTGRAHTVDAPPVVQTIELRTGDTGDDGTQVTFEVTEAHVAAAGTDLTEAEVKVFDRSLRASVGTTGHGLLTPRGQFVDVEVEPAEGSGSGDDLGAQVAALAPVLPAEPVGVGAQWTTVQPIGLGNLQARQTTRYEVTAIDGEQVSYRAETVVTAGAQALPGGPLGGLPEGTTGRLASARYTGTSRGTLHLDLPAGESRAEVSGTQTVVLHQQGQSDRNLEHVVQIATRVRLPEEASP